MSKEAKAYYHKWIGDEKDLRDRYEVMQDYAEKYYKDQLLLHEVLGQSEQLPNMTLEQAIEKAKPNMDKIKDVDNYLDDIR